MRIFRCYAPNAIEQKETKMMVTTGKLFSLNIKRVVLSVRNQGAMK